MSRYTFKPYSPLFPELFAKEKVRIEQGLDLDVQIEHVGSTAVPGLGGKGTIDIAIRAASPDKIKQHLIQLGYEFRPGFSTPERLYFVRYQPDREDLERRYHIHLLHPQSREWSRFLAFRDTLRTCAKARQEYAAMKLKAVNEKKEGEAYRLYKEPMIKKVLEESWVVPSRLKKGDRIAVLSLSSGLPSVFPWVFDWGLKRLREQFGLEVVEFPTARASCSYLASHPQARAQDVHAAFADPSIQGVFASIGGNDQDTILPYLDKELLKAHPKMFVGYSDNTHLHLFLWKLGIVSYYGAHVMNQFAMQGSMHPLTVDAIEQVLFGSKPVALYAANQWTDEDLPWEDPANLTRERTLYPGKQWHWCHADQPMVEGRLWGGCLEVIEKQLANPLLLPAVEQLEGGVLFLETSEEMPSAERVYQFFMALAKKGILQAFRAILMGRAKAQFCGRMPPEGKEAFIENQQRAIEQALRDAGCSPVAVFNMNFGHTDPQWIIPSGGIARVDGRMRSVCFL